MQFVSIGLSTLDSRRFQRSSVVTLDNRNSSVLIECHPVGVTSGRIQHPLLWCKMNKIWIRKKQTYAMNKQYKHRLTQISLDNHGLNRGGVGHSQWQLSTLEQYIDPKFSNFRIFNCSTLVSFNSAVHHTKFVACYYDNYIFFLI